jgi:4-hydroxy-L-threonine phosphate dehydrogenase PdxA
MMLASPILAILNFLPACRKPIVGAPLMMLACDELRVVPATIHIALNKVPASHFNSANHRKMSASVLLSKDQFWH